MPRCFPIAPAAVAALLAIILPSAGWGDEFQAMAVSMGTTTTLVGKPQTTTTDANGVAINFWAQNPTQYEGALASTVPLSNPHMAQADAYGNIYIADKASHAVLKITADGHIHTFAGTHAAGFNGDGPGPATSLQLTSPNGLFVLPDGTVWLLDPGNHRIRRVTPDGVMTTVVNDPEPNWYPSGRALWVSPDQQLIYYTNEFAPVPPSIIADGACVKRWTPAGGIEVVCQKSVGFRNPANCAVNPVDGKLYLTDRAEDDTTKLATGLWRIDGMDARTRMTGPPAAPLAADGQLAANSFVEQPRGIAFLSNGAYFLCTHKAIAGSTNTGDIWYVDSAGALHRYLHGRGSRDYYNLTSSLHPPLIGLAPNGQEWISQPRAVALAPNGSLLVVCNDSGFVFRVNNLVPHLPSDLRSAHFGVDGMRLTWSGLFGRGYLVERTGSLGSPNWQTIGAAGGQASGVPSEFLDPAAFGQTADFYRLAPAQ